jgi:transposase
VRSLERDSLLVERVERLMTIPAVGPITALTWALEVGDVQRFSSIKKAISYCGLHKWLVVPTSPVSPPLSC